MTTTRPHQKHHRPALRRCALATSLACGLMLGAGPAQALNVVWGGGNGVWTNSLGWVGQLYPNFSSDSVYIDGGNLQASAVTLTSSVNIGQLFIDSGDSLSIAGGGMLGLTGNTLSNNGTLTVAASNSSPARLNIGSALTLSGSGTTVLASDASGHRAAVSGGSLTIAAGHTVRGAGDLGSYTYGSLSVVNQGTVIAEGGTLNTYQAGGQKFDNTAGLVQIAGGSALVASGQFMGGTVQSLASGADTAKLGGNTFNDVALRGSLAVLSNLSLNGGSIHDSLLVQQATLNAIGTITNNGTLTLAATGSGPARLNIGSALTLSGSGSTVLASDASGHRAAVSGGSLTIAAGHTVRGAGDLGSYTYGSLSVVNQGTVIAEGGTLNTYQAGGQKFDNTAGLVQIAGGSALVASGQFMGGTVQSLASGTDTAKLGGNTFNDVALRGSLAVLNSLSLSASTIHDSLLVAGATLNATGVITNNGTLTLAGTSTGWGRMGIGTVATLAGTGTTVLASDASGHRGTISGGSLTIAAGHTVRGAGDLGSYSFGTSSVVNQGTVIAEGGSLNVYQSGGQSFDNSAGLVQIADGASLLVNGKFMGGTVQGLGNSSLSGGSFSNLTLSGSLAVAAGNMASVSGTLTNNGSLSLAASSGAYSRLNIAADTALAGHGVTTLASNASGHRGVISGSGVLTVANGHTVRGAGDLGNNSFGSLAVINQGTLVAEGGTLSLYQTGSQSFDNSAGLIQISNGATLAVSGKLNGGSVQSLGAGNLSGSTLSNIGLHGQLAVTGSLGLSNATIHDSLSVAGASLGAAGTITNQGSLALIGTASAWGRMQVSSASPVTLAGNGVTLLASDASGHRGVIAGGGTLTIASGHTVRGNGDLGNASFGTLAVINQGSVIAEGGTLNVNSGSTAFDNQAGVLAVQAGSKLSFNSALSLADASQLQIGVTGSSGLASVGLLQLAGNAAFDGQVLFDLSGYTAAVGDSFTFATYSGSYSGAFDAVGAAGYTFSTTYANHQVTATITGVSAVPEPQGWAMLMAGLFIVGKLARRRRTAAR